MQNFDGDYYFLCNENKPDKNLVMLKMCKFQTKGVELTPKIRKI